MVAEPMEMMLSRRRSRPVVSTSIAQYLASRQPARRSMRAVAADLATHLTPVTFVLSIRSRAGPERWRWHGRNHGDVGGSGDPGHVALSSWTGACRPGWRQLPP